LYFDINDVGDSNESPNFDIAKGELVFYSPETRSSFAVFNGMACEEVRKGEAYRYLGVSNNDVQIRGARLSLPIGHSRTGHLNVRCAHPRSLVVGDHAFWVPPPVEWKDGMKSCMGATMGFSKKHITPILVNEHDFAHYMFGGGVDGAEVRASVDVVDIITKARPDGEGSPQTMWDIMAQYAVSVWSVVDARRAAAVAAGGVIDDAALHIAGRGGIGSGVATSALVSAMMSTAIGAAGAAADRHAKDRCIGSMRTMMELYCKISEHYVGKVEQDSAPNSPVLMTLGSADTFMF
jgi:hypothetical protein